MQYRLFTMLLLLELALLFWGAVVYGAIAESPMILAIIPALLHTALFMMALLTFIEDIKE